MDKAMLSDLGLVAGDAVTGKIPEAVWPGKGDSGLLYPGCLGFLAGPSGQGKSLATNKIMADWTRTRGHVIVNDGEDGGVHGGMSRIRLEASGADMGKVLYGEFSIPGDLAQLEAAVEALGGQVLIVWDTAADFIDAPPQRWGKALAPLASGVLPRTGAIGILVHHTLKNARKGSDWKQTIGGATNGITGKARFGMIYGPRPDDGGQRLLVLVKDQYRDVRQNGVYNRTVAFEFDEEDMDDGSGNLRPVSFLRVAEKGVGIANPSEIVYLGGENGGPRGPSPEKAAEAAQWLCELLADGAMPVSDAVQCMTHPDGDPNGPKNKDGVPYGCGYMSAAKVAGGSCPYCGGPVQLVQGMKETAEQDGLSYGGAIRKALTALQCVSGRKGSKDVPGGIVFYWRLPDGHPAIANPQTHRSVLP